MVTASNLAGLPHVWNDEGGGRHGGITLGKDPPMAPLLGIVAVVVIVTGLLALHRYAGSLAGRPLAQAREAHSGSAHVDNP